jgi:hypothetical protein
LTVLTVRSPPIILQDARLIASPRPVPPYLLLVDASAWENACQIARKGVESSERVGWHRWTVERTIAWLTGHRRLATRCELRADILTGLLHLACSLIALRFVTPDTGW